MDTAGAVEDPAQRSSGQQPQQQQQWDRFEVVLSKPSGSQKLGMVLKHAQVFGEERLKRGAYLAGLAEGPSLAQDLGLSPKDRLILVEGLDVKTLPFDRIVGLIRKATFPLTLVWSRQRKAGIAQAALPGTAIRQQHPPTNRDGTPPPLPPSAAASTSAPFSSDKTAVATTSNNPDAAATADWEQATSKGRAASRASREAEGEEREGAGRRNPRVSSTDASEDVAAAGQQQQTQRAPIGEPIQDWQQQQQRSSSGGNRARNAAAEAAAYVPPLEGAVPMAPKPSPSPPTTATIAPAGNGSRRSPASAGRKSREATMSLQQQRELPRETNGNGKDSGNASGNGGCGGSSNSTDAPLTAQRRRDRDKVRRDKVREDAGPGGGVGVDNDGGVGCGANGSGSGNSSRNSSSSSSSSHQPQATPAASKRGRSGRGAGRGGGRGGRRGGGRGGKGKGAEAARAAASATGTAEATAAAVAAAAAGDAGRDDVAAPEWLNPLMKTVLPEFQGTRYARSRLKQTLAHEWARQEYRTGIALGQVDRGMTEMEFVRRRVEGGSLYALLEQESRDYLRVGPFTDADVELLGMSFAQAQASKELPPPAAAPKPDAAAAESVPKSAKSGQEKASKTGQEKGAKAGKQSSGKDAAAAKAGAAAEGGVASWADRLRDFQIDIPASATYDGLASDSSRGGGAADRTDGQVVAEAAQKGGSQQEDDASAWDGIGVDAATVIRHRRQFDLRCRAYEALNTASRNDKTNGLLEKTHRLRQDHAAIVAAKRVTLEGTLQNVRQQLNGREDQLRHVHMEQRGVNPLDTTVVAGLNESEAAIMTRVAEKKVQMAMIIDEANKVVQWEQTAELARREAMHHAADMHGHGGGFAPGSAKERNELVQSMMSQKVNIMLLSTFCKLRGPWLAPSGYVRGKRSVSDGAAGSAVAAAEEKGAEPDPRTAVVSSPSLSVSTAENTAAAAAADDKQGDRPPSGGKDDSGSGGVGEPKSSSSSPTSAAGGNDGAGSGPAAGAGAGVEAKPGKRQIKLRLLPPSEAEPKKEKGDGDPGQDAHRQQPGQQAEGGGDAGAACTGPSYTVAAEGTASRAGDSSGDGFSSMAAVMAMGGKEAAMASLAGARGTGSVREQDGVDAGSKGGDGPAPMDATASTASGNEGGDRDQEDDPKPEARDASSLARRGSPSPAEGDMDKGGAGAGSHSPQHSTPPADAGSLRLSEGGGGVGEDVSNGSNGMDVDTV